MLKFCSSPKTDDETAGNLRVLQNVARLTLDNFGEEVKLSRYFDSIIGIHPSDAVYTSDHLFGIDLLFHRGSLTALSFVGQARKFMTEYQDMHGLSILDVSLEVSLSDPAGHRKDRGTFYNVSDLVRDDNLLKRF